MTYKPSGILTFTRWDGKPHLDILIEAHDESMRRLAGLKAACEEAVGATMEEYAAKNNERWKREYGFDYYAWQESRAKE